MRPKRAVLAVVAAAAAGAALYLALGRGAGQASPEGPPAGNGQARPGAGPGGRAGGPSAAASLAPNDRALLATLPPERQEAVLEAYRAARAAGKRARLADFMPETAYSVKVVEARLATLREYIDVSGDVLPATSVDACPDIGGRLVGLSVALGDWVERGQVIAQVDPSTPGSMYALSPVRAPISGTITDIAAEAGAKVTASTAVATVGILDRLKVETLIRERDVAAVRPGQRVLLRFEAFPGRTFEARVASVSPVLDKTSRTKAATILLEEGVGRVAPGMYARARVYTAVRADVVAVEEAAVFERFGDFFVYAVDRREDGDRARLAKVERGAIVDGLVELRSGVAAGERVVTAGRAALGDGSLVRVVSGGGEGK